MGKYLVPGTPLGGEHTAAEIRQIGNEPPLSGGQRYSIAGTHQRASISLRSADVRSTVGRQCPLWEVKQTSVGHSEMSAFDPMQILAVD
jgi:hypothetical protein